MSELRWLMPAGMRSCPGRVIALRPRDRQELREWLIDRAHAMLFPPTRGRPAPGDPVLLDLALDGDRVWLPAATRYTLPAHRGPIFVCTPRGRAAIALLLRGERRLRRAHARLPIALASVVSFDEGGLEPATTVDVSAIGARLATTSPLSAGSVALGFPGPRPVGFPAILRGRIVARRGEEIIIHFSTGEERGWVGLRRWLRRIDETGVVHLPPAPAAGGPR